MRCAARKCETMSIAAKILGLEGGWAEPDWPFLALDEVDRVLRGFPQAGGAERILSFSPRPFSAASIVETPRGKVFVKRHHAAIRDRAGLHEEHAFLRHLRRHGAPVPMVLADERGETAISVGEWTYEVHEAAAGVDLYERAQSWTPFLHAGHARAAGAALARLHRAAEGYDAPARSTRMLVTSFRIFAADDPWPRFEEYLGAHPATAAYLGARDWRRQCGQVLTPFHERLKPWLRYARPLWTHNDLHASNLLWSGAEPDAQATAIIDFGLSDRTTGAHDIATAIERNGIEWLELLGGKHDIVHLDQIDALLAGYESERRLAQEEARLVARLLPLVHVEFALAETEYFLSVLQSEKSAALAYEGYLLAHAEWFASDEGGELLDHLEAWADRHQPLASLPSQQPPTLVG
jgi:Ser/Thr protein kinase RdoA (MazF antagonist)